MKIIVCKFFEGLMVQASKQFLFVSNQLNLYRSLVHFLSVLYINRIFVYSAYLSGVLSMQTYFKVFSLVFYIKFSRNYF